MIHPSDPKLTTAVRDGRDAPVTCAVVWLSPGGDRRGVVPLQPDLGGRDARGCRVACADAAHDAAGRAIAVAV